MEDPDKTAATAAGSAGGVAAGSPGGAAAGSPGGAAAGSPGGAAAGPALEALRGTIRGAAVELRGVSKVHRGPQGDVTTLAAFDLDIKAGEFVCLLGPSGCGKSTLLNLVAGLDVPSSGQVLVNGRPVRGPGPDRTVMFQDPALFPWLSLRQNVAFPLELAGVRKAEITARVERALRMVHLWRFADAPIHTLSGGMKQRGALARALVSEPVTLLMDEPFAALDAQTRDVLYGELENVWQTTGKTVIFVTHNVREAVRLGDRIVVMATRPGRLRKLVQVKLSRPRGDVDPDVAVLAGVVMDELREEIARVQRQEADDAWQMGRPAGAAGGDPDLGGGI